MKKLLCAVILFTPLLANAQSFPGADPQKMQAMMKKAQEMQTCIKNVDQAKIQAFQQRAQQTGTEIKALCSAGKRAEALSKAMAFSKEIASDKSMQQIKRCSEIMKGFMPDSADIAQTYNKDSTAGDICGQ